MPATVPRLRFLTLAASAVLIAAGPSRIVVGRQAASARAPWTRTAAAPTTATAEAEPGASRATTLGHSLCGHAYAIVYQRACFARRPQSLSTPVPTATPRYVGYRTPTVRV